MCECTSFLERISGMESSNGSRGPQDLIAQTTRPCTLHAKQWSDNATINEPVEEVVPPSVQLAPVCIHTRKYTHIRARDHHAAKCKQTQHWRIDYRAGMHGMEP